MDFGLSSVERYLLSSRLVYRQNKRPKTIIYLVPEALERQSWAVRQKHLLKQASEDEKPLLAA